MVSLRDSHPGGNSLPLAVRLKSEEPIRDALPYAKPALASALNTSTPKLLHCSVRTCTATKKPAKFVLSSESAQL